MVRSSAQCETPQALDSLYRCWRGQWAGGSARTGLYFSEAGAKNRRHQPSCPRNEITAIHVYENNLQAFLHMNTLGSEGHVTLF